MHDDPTKIELTDKQRRALEAIGNHGQLSPANIGYAISDPPGIFHLTPQGAGFLGGRVASNLHKKGLAENTYWSHVDKKTGGMSTWRYGYKITPLGRKVLKAKEVK